MAVREIARVDGCRWRRAASGFTGEIVWVGLRDAAGKETASTLAIEEYILSGLVREGVSFSISESVPSTWPNGVIPWEEGASAGQVLGGQLAEDGLWAYLRLSLVDGVQGDRLQVAVRGVEMRHVEDEVAQRARADGKGDERLPIEVELHWVVLRSEGDIRRWLGTKRARCAKETRFRCDSGLIETHRYTPFFLALKESVSHW